VEGRYEGDRDAQRAERAMRAEPEAGGAHVGGRARQDLPVVARYFFFLAVFFAVEWAAFFGGVGMAMDMFEFQMRAPISHWLFTLCQ
jgi:hypothetical protein